MDKENKVTANMSKGYENSSCNMNDVVGASVSTVNVEHKAVNDVQVEVARCCGGSNTRTDNLDSKTSNVSESTVAPQICLPKCPAVKLSPWDPTKTWSVVVLSVAMFVWLLVGVYVIQL